MVEVGDEIRGRYLVLGRLGQGAQGETLEAEDRTTGKRVALKRFFVRGASSWKEVELAEREALVQQTLAHPNLPTYIDHFEDAGTLCLVMERIEGESLAVLVERGGVLKPEDVLRFLREAAGTLSYLHGLVPPVVHRDIKPGNVIRRPDGGYTLVDFGSVRHRLKPHGGSTVAGTFGYMAPEQLQGRAGPESDVYAVATTALAAMTGMQPEDMPHRGLAIDVAKLLGKRADRGLVRALAAMLEPDPERRPASVELALTRQELLVPGTQPSLRSRALGFLGEHKLVSALVLACTMGLPVALSIWHPKPPLSAKDERPQAAWAKAEQAFRLGDISDAGRAFASARALEPRHALSFREAEAVSIYDPRGAAKLVLGLKQAWYRGPTDPGQALLDCVASVLHDDVPLLDGAPKLCLMPPLDRRQWARTELSHNMPAYALHDPASYVRFWPIYDAESPPTACGSQIPELASLVALNCEADLGVRRALFNAMVGDNARLSQDLELADNVLWHLQNLLAHRSPSRERGLVAQAKIAGVSLADLEQQRESARFSAERILAVATSAAWFGHDDARVTAYLPYAEAHARGIFEEHLALIAGRQRAPSAEHTPSDFSAVDIEFFRSVDIDSAEQLARKLENLDYAEPARLAELLGVARSTHFREALSRWVHAEPKALPATRGIFAELESAFRRREAARLLGDAVLEASLRTKTLKLGKLLRDPRYFAPIASLESLISR